MAAAPVLIAVDFSEPSRQAVAEGTRLAKEGGAGIVLVHALAPLPRVPAYAASLGASYESLEAHQHAHMVEEAKRLTDEWADPLRERGFKVEVVCEEGPADDVILDAAARVQPRVIVIGSHGWTGLRRFVLGSVAQTVLHRSRWPVLVVPAGDGEP